MKPVFSPTLFFENAAGQLLAEPAGFLHAVWSEQPRRLEDTQAMFHNMRRGLQQFGWNRILIDQVRMRPFSPQEQAWVAKEWLSAAVREGGYRYGAVLVSPDVLTRLATAFITTQVQGLPLVYHSFDDEKAAVVWLLRQAA